MTDLNMRAPRLRFDTIPRDARSPTSLVSQRQRLGTWARRHVTPSRAFAASAAFYLLLCALSFFVVRPTTLLYFTDYWEHRAIVGEIARHGLQPLDPIYGEHASSRQYTPWSLVLGYLARFGPFDIDTVMAWGAMTVSLLFLFGVHRFARIFYAHRWAPVLLLAVLTCAWGLPALIWTGFYAFRSQLHCNYYPAAFVFALTFIGWSTVLHLMRGKTRALPDAALLWAVVTCCVITHPLNAGFLVAGALGFAVLEPGVALQRRALVMSLIAAGVSATIFWPYFNPLSLAGAGFARGQATFNNFSFFYDPLFVIALTWPALFGLLGLRDLLRERMLRMPLLGLGLTFTAYVVGGLADISVSHRLLAYIMVMLHLISVKAILDIIDGRIPGLMRTLSTRAWRVISVVTVILVLMQIAMTVQQLTSPWAYAGPPYALHEVDADTSRVVAALPPGARILGWDSAALVMPAHGVLVVAFPRPMPLSPTDFARQTDYRRFFTSGTSTCDRVAIARRWGATHIAYLTNELKEPVQRELADLGHAISPVAPWRLIPVPDPKTMHC